MHHWDYELISDWRAFMVIVCTILSGCLLPTPARQSCPPWQLSGKKALFLKKQPGLLQSRLQNSEKSVLSKKANMQSRW